jgi:hypothetical protein
MNHAEIQAASEALQRLSTHDAMTAFTCAMLADASACTASAAMISTAVMIAASLPAAERSAVAEHLFREGAELREVCNQ